MVRHLDDSFEGDSAGRSWRRPRAQDPGETGRAEVIEGLLRGAGWATAADQDSAVCWRSICVCQNQSLSGESSKNSYGRTAEDIRIRKEKGHEGKEKDCKQAKQASRRPKGGMDGWMDGWMDGRALARRGASSKVQRMDGDGDGNERTAKLNEWADGDRRTGGSESCETAREADGRGRGGQE